MQANPFPLFFTQHQDHPKNCNIISREKTLSQTEATVYLAICEHWNADEYHYLTALLCLVIPCFIISISVNF